MPYIPPELISVIVGFAAEGNTSECQPLLTPLSLVSRTWLTASRRELSQRRKFVIGVIESEEISNFLDILESRDCLPNLPHILSFMSTVMIKIPLGCSEPPEISQQTFMLLDNLAKRQEFFQPKNLYLKGYRSIWLDSEKGPPCPSRLITAISKTFSTITQLHFNTPPVTNYCSNLDYLHFSLKKLQAIHLVIWDAALFTNEVAEDGSPCIYRLPEGLRTLEYNLRPVMPDCPERTLAWLQSHRPLHQMQRLSFLGAVPDTHTIMQALVNICPNLDTLCVSHGIEPIFREAGGVLDLSRNKKLDRLCFHIPEFQSSDLLDCREAILKTVLLTVQTATSLSGVLDIVAYASHFRGSGNIHWWSLLSEAISALPHGFVFKLQVVCADRSKLMNEKGEDVIRKIFGKLSKRRRVLFRIEDSQLWLGQPGWDFFKAADESTWQSLEGEDK